MYTKYVVYEIVYFSILDSHSELNRRKRESDSETILK